MLRAASGRTGPGPIRHRAGPAVAAVAAVSVAVLGACSDRGPDASADPPAREAPAGSPRDLPGPDDPAALVRELGCGACHGGLPAPRPARRRAPSLGADGRPLPAGFLFAYLRSPRRLRPGLGRTRMPDFHLSEKEAAALTLFLSTTLPEDSIGAGAEADAAGDAAPPPVAPDDGEADGLRRLRERFPGATARRGRRIFAALNCAGCHGGTDVEPWTNGPDLSPPRSGTRRAWLADWLGEPRAVRPFGYFPGTGGRMPDFGLDEAELDALVAFLAPGPAARADRGGSGTPEPSAPAAAADTVSSPARGEGLSPYRAAKAEKILRRRLPCLGCHRLGPEGGRIGPRLAGVARRRTDGYIRSMIVRPRETAPAAVMPPTRADPETRRLVVRYLQDGGAPRAPGRRGEDRGSRTEAPRSGYLSLVDRPLRAPDPWMRSDADSAPDASTLYRHQCSACHGAEGGGDGYNAPFLDTPPTAHADSAYMAGRPDGTLFDGVFAGGRVLGRSARMPAFGHALPRDRIWGLVGHLRELCGCRGPAWYRDNEESGVPSAGGAR